ncbi:hypothetical protein LPJ70_005804 [Coemansia sp. RSA 2708]|nr:hypothetical protein LPJ70_005804 [Coemansia sp. RSA 2708]
MADSLRITRGSDELKSYRAIKDKAVAPSEQTLCQNRYFCTTCASYLWAHSDEWPQWIYPYASAIDTALPVPGQTASIMLDSAAEWAKPDKVQKRNETFAGYPPYSLEQWHAEHADLG